MKFLTKINRNYIFLLIGILLIVSTAGYFILQYVVFTEAKESLIQKEFLIRKQISETNETPNIYPIVEVHKINEPTHSKPQFKKVFIQNTLENEDEPYIEYSTEVKINKSYYSIKLRQSLIEGEDLIFIILFSDLALLVSLFGISFFISKRLNQSVWADFEHNLSEIEQFNFTEGNTLSLKDSKIIEFDRLNKVVTKLTDKLKSDYASLKEFTENASHEIQTPLSIALMNLEELLQQDLSEENFKSTVAAINALKRLSSLNKSLILLTKIKNRQFKAKEPLILNSIIKRKSEEFAGMFESKQIQFELTGNDNFEIMMNEKLAEMLINNLLSNSIKHNYPEGRIRIDINKNEVTFCNTGKNNTLNKETVFNRFSKGNTDSFGLGLAIVKDICDTHNLSINYKKNEEHCFIISKKEH